MQQECLSVKSQCPLANRCMLPSTTWTCSNLFTWENPHQCEQTHRQTWLKTLPSRKLHIRAVITSYFLLRWVPLTNLLWHRYYWHERSRISHQMLSTFLRLVQRHKKHNDEPSTVYRPYLSTLPIPTSLTRNVGLPVERLVGLAFWAHIMYITPLFLEGNLKSIHRYWCFFNILSNMMLCCISCT